MAGFVFTATARIGVNNLGPTVSKIQSAFNGIKANVNVNIAGGAQAQIKALQAQIANLNNAANSRGINSGNAATANLGKTYTTVAKSANSAGRATYAFGEQVGASARRFTAFSVAAGSILTLVSAIKSGVSEALEFQHQLVRLAQTGGDNQKVIGGISQEISRLSTSLGVSSLELVKASVTFRQAGLSATETKTALEALAKTTLAPSFGDISNTVEAAIAAMQQFNIKAKDLESTFGSINAVSAAFAVESEDLTQVIRRSGGAFQAAGGSLNELLALFTSVRSTTRESAESISSGFNTIFARVQRSDTIDKLKELGIQLRYTEEDAKNFGKTEGDFVGPAEAVKRLGLALSSIPSASGKYADIVEELGGSRQISKVIPLLQQQAKYQLALNTAQEGYNSLTATTETAQGSFIVQLTKVKESFLDLFRTISENKTLQLYAGAFLKIADAAIALSKALIPLLPAITAIAAIKLGQGFTNLIGLGGNSNFQKGLKAGITRPRRYASGGPTGVVPGRGSTDNFPANLSNGQFVLKKRAVESLGGADNVHAMVRSSNPNALLMPGEYVVDEKDTKRIGLNTLRKANAKRFADGGLVHMAEGDLPRSRYRYRIRKRLPIDPLPPVDTRSKAAQKKKEKRKLSEFIAKEPPSKEKEAKILATFRKPRGFVPKTPLELKKEREAEEKREKAVQKAAKAAEKAEAKRLRDEEKARYDALSKEEKKKYKYDKVSKNVDNVKIAAYLSKNKSTVEKFAELESKRKSKTIKIPIKIIKKKKSTSEKILARNREIELIGHNVYAEARSRMLSREEVHRRTIEDNQKLFERDKNKTRDYKPLSEEEIEAQARALTGMRGSRDVVDKKGNVKVGLSASEEYKKLVTGESTVSSERMAIFEAFQGKKIQEGRKKRPEISVEQAEKNYNYRVQQAQEKAETEKRVEAAKKAKNDKLKAAAANTATRIKPIKPTKAEPLPATGLGRRVKPVDQPQEVPAPIVQAPQPVPALPRIPRGTPDRVQRAGELRELRRKFAQPREEVRAEELKRLQDRNSEENQTSRSLSKDRQGYSTTPIGRDIDFEASARAKARLQNKVRTSPAVAKPKKRLSAINLGFGEGFGSVKLTLKQIKAHRDPSRIRFEPEHSDKIRSALLYGRRGRYSDDKRRLSEAQIAQIIPRPVPKNKKLVKKIVETSEKQIGEGGVPLGYGIPRGYGLPLSSRLSALPPVTPEVPVENRRVRGTQGRIERAQKLREARQKRVEFLREVAENPIPQVAARPNFPTLPIVKAPRQKDPKALAIAQRRLQLKQSKPVPEGIRNQLIGTGFEGLATKENIKSYGEFAPNSLENNPRGLFNSKIGIRLRNNLNPEAAAGTFAHELTHAADYNEARKTGSKFEFASHDPNTILGQSAALAQPFLEKSLGRKFDKTKALGRKNISDEYLAAGAEEYFKKKKGRAFVSDGAYETPEAKAFLEHFEKQVLPSLGGGTKPVTKPRSAITPEYVRRTETGRARFNQRPLTEKDQQAYDSNISRIKRTFTGTFGKPLKQRYATRNIRNDKQLSTYDVAKLRKDSRDKRPGIRYADGRSSTPLMRLPDEDAVARTLERLKTKGGVATPKTAVTEGGESTTLTKTSEGGKLRRAVLAETKTEKEENDKYSETRSTTTRTTKVGTKKPKVVTTERITRKPIKPKLARPGKAPKVPDEGFPTVEAGLRKRANQENQRLDEQSRFQRVLAIEAAGLPLSDTGKAVKAAQLAKETQEKEDDRILRSAKANKLDPKDKARYDAIRQQRAVESQKVFTDPATGKSVNPSEVLQKYPTNKAAQAFVREAAEVLPDVTPITPKVAKPPKKRPVPASRRNYARPENFRALSRNDKRAEARKAFDAKEKYESDRFDNLQATVNTGAKLTGEDKRFFARRQNKVNNREANADLQKRVDAGEIVKPDEAKRFNAKQARTGSGVVAHSSVTSLKGYDKALAQLTTSLQKEIKARNPYLSQLQANTEASKKAARLLEADPSLVAGTAGVASRVKIKARRQGFVGIDNLSDDQRNVLSQNIDKNIGKGRQFRDNSFVDAKGNTRQTTLDASIKKRVEAGKLELVPGSKRTFQRTAARRAQIIDRIINGAQRRDADVSVDERGDPTGISGVTPSTARGRRFRPGKRLRAVGNFANKFRGLGGVRAAATTAIIGSQYIDDLIPDKDREGNPNKTVKALKGAATGAAGGAFTGSFVGGPYGAAIGAAIGGLHGFVTALRETEKEIKDISLGKILDQLSASAENVLNQDTTSKKLELGDLSTNLKQVRAQGLNQSETREKFGASAGNLQNIGNKLAEEIVKTSEGGKKTDSERRNEFFNAGGGAGLEISSFLAQLKGISIKEVGDQFAKVVQSLEEAKGLEKKFNESSKTISRNITNFNRLNNAVDAATSSIVDLQTGFNNTLALLDGNVGIAPVTQISSGINSVGKGDGKAFQGSVDFVASSVGRGDPQFESVLREQAASIDQAFKRLPEILIGIAEKPNLSSDDTTSLIRDRLKAVGIDEGTAKTISQKVGATPQDELLKQVRDNVNAFSESKLTEAFGPLLDSLGKGAKGLEDRINEYNNSLAKIVEVQDRIGEASDRGSELSLNAVRARTQIRATRIGLPDLAERSIPLARLEAPQVERQQRLTGLGEAASFDPNAIGEKLRQVVGQIAQAQNVYNEAIQKNSGIEGAARNLLTLQNSAKNLQEALKNLTDTTTRVAEIQNKLSVISEERQSRTSFAKRIIGSSDEDKFALQQNLQLANQASRQGNYNGFTSDQAARIQETLDSLGSIRLPQFGGLKGTEVADKLAQNTLPGIANLPADVAQEERQLQGELIQRMDKAVQANDVLKKFLEGSQTSLYGQLADINRKFLDEFKKILIEGQKIGLVQKSVDAGTAKADRQKQFDAARKVESSGLNLDQARQITTGPLAGDFSSLVKGAGFQKDILAAQKGIAKTAPDVSLGGNVQGQSIEVDKSLNAVIQRFADTNLKNVDVGKDFSADLFTKLREQLIKGSPEQTGFQRSLKVTDGGFTDEGHAGTVTNQSKLEGFLSASLANISRDLLSNRSAQQQQQDQVKQAEIGKQLGVDPSVIGRLSTQDRAKELSDDVKLIPREVRSSADLETALKSLSTEFTNLQANIAKLNEVLGVSNEKKLNIFDPSTYGPTVRKADGGPIFSPRGTDTVPAMLSPGEFVVNARAARANQAILNHINKNTQPIYRAGGGPVRRKGFIPGEYNPFDVFDTAIGKALEKEQQPEPRAPYVEPAAAPDRNFDPTVAPTTEIKDTRPTTQTTKNPNFLDFLDSGLGSLVGRSDEAQKQKPQSPQSNFNVGQALNTDPNITSDSLRDVAYTANAQKKKFEEGDAAYKASPEYKKTLETSALLAARDQKARADLAEKTQSVAALQQKNKEFLEVREDPTLGFKQKVQEQSRTVANAPIITPGASLKDQVAQDKASAAARVQAVLATGRAVDIAREKRRQDILEANKKAPDQSRLAQETLYAAAQKAAAFGNDDARPSQFTGVRRSTKRQIVPAAPTPLQQLGLPTVENTLGLFSPEMPTGLEPKQKIKKKQIQKNIPRYDSRRPVRQKYQPLTYKKRGRGRSGFFADGGMAVGTDTIPAMLTPGEFIVNAASAKANMPILHAINALKAPLYKATGGPIGAGGSNNAGVGLPTIDFSGFISAANNLAGPLKDFASTSEALGGLVGGLKDLMGPLNLFGQNIQGFIQPFSTFNTVATPLANSLTLFASAAPGLTKAMNALANLPSTITVNGTQDVKVTYSGLEAMNAVVDDLKKKIDGLAQKLGGDSVKDIKDGKVI